jgi:hypothetical protein
MCGDLDEDDRVEEALVARFRAHARAVLAHAPAGASGGTAAYLDKLFADALSRCVRDCEGAEEGERYDILAAQPVALARLAGFLAAHSALKEDPLRKTLEALMHGYAEAEAIAPDHAHDHGHQHDHGHGPHRH